MYRLPFLDHIGAKLVKVSKEEAILSIKAVGRVIRMGGRVAFAVVEVKNMQELVAYATGTYAILSLRGAS